jgi:hypothetical protein
MLKLQFIGKPKQLKAFMKYVMERWGNKRLKDVPTIVCR